MARDTDIKQRETADSRREHVHRRFEVGTVSLEAGLRDVAAGRDVDSGEQIVYFSVGMPHSRHRVFCNIICDT